MERKLKAGCSSCIVNRDVSDHTQLDQEGLRALASGLAVHICNCSTGEARGKGAGGQCGLQSEPLSPDKQQKQKGKAIAYCSTQTKSMANITSAVPTSNANLDGFPATGKQ